MSSGFKQLNPFELKMALNKLLSKINSVNDIKDCLSDIDLLEAQEDKSLLGKLLFKELSNSPKEKISVICFLLEHFVSKDELVSGLWELMKNKNLNTDIRVMVLNMLRELDADWSYDSCAEYVEDADEILDENTKQLLKTAIINPEVQIDFMDFLTSIKTEDKITLLNSFEKDFESDALANILIPVFESKPNSPEGREALNLLASTKSQLALNMLERMGKYTTGELNQCIRKGLATLKMSGMRTDNSKEFYKKILSDTKPDKFYLTYPDGRGDVAMICTRTTSQERIRFISIVINLETGIRDCFGFYDISKFECDKILEKFLKNEKVVSVAPEYFKNILFNAEIKTIEYSKSDWELPYEYICWRNLLVDIDSEDEYFDKIVKEHIIPQKVDDSIIKELDNMKVSSHWFLDADYSDEFEDLIADVKNESNLDKLVADYKTKIFYKEEKQCWINKLIFSAYIKYVIGKDDEAEKIYGLIFDENLFEKFLTEILKRSVYEYLMLIKYNKDLNVLVFTDEVISDRIAYIEKNWVNSDV